MSETDHASELAALYERSRGNQIKTRFYLLSLQKRLATIEREILRKIESCHAVEESLAEKIADLRKEASRHRREEPPPAF